MALCKCIATNYKLLGIDWEKIADALRDISLGKLAMRIRWDYCHYGKLILALTLCIDIYARLYTFRGSM